MSVKSFIPQIWEARLVAKDHEKSIAGVISTAPKEIKGDKIIFNKVGAVAVKDYLGNIVWDDVSTEPIEMDMDIKKYWAIKVKDVDAVQAAGDLIDSHADEATSQVNEKFDAAVLTKALTTTNTITAAAGDKAYDIIVKLNTVLNKNKISKSGRNCVINAEVLEELNLDDRFNRNYTILENGVVEGASINGTTLVFSEELNSGKYAICTIQKACLGYGKQYQDTEAMRLQDDFADGVRGLAIGGTTILKGEGIAKYVKPAVVKSK